ncbi:MAG TPA: YjbE family putative metal transport protein [Nevskiaceae bacterium]|nr:YjbE family putative metal transport protein [Nevskiaceae bacterium]
MEFFITAAFWIGLLKVIGVNILLSGDNAVVIAMAARSLPAHNRNKAIVWGSAVAVALRVVLTLAAAFLLDLPYVHIVCGILLLWIGICLLDDNDTTQDTKNSETNLLTVIRIIVVADLVMSLDNVIGVAAAANGSLVLLILGLVISIPIIIFSSTWIMRIMDRLPIIITAGAGLIGWIAGETIIKDPVLWRYVAGIWWMYYAATSVCALLAIAIGYLLRNLKEGKHVARM